MVKLAFSLAKKEHQLEYYKSGGPDGGGYIHLKSDNDGYWSYMSETFKIDRRGKALLAKTKVRCRNGHVNFRIFGIKGKNLTKGVVISSFDVKKNADWDDAITFYDIDYDQIYFIFSGPGKIDVDFAPITLYTAVPQNQDRPKVEGYAKKRREEKLDRGLLVLPEDNGAFLSWRFLNSDTDTTGFLIDRTSAASKEYKRLTEQPITMKTNYTDTTAEAGKEYTWRISTVVNGKATGETASVSLSMPKSGEEKKQYISIPLQGDYKAEAVALADVDGDGRLDYIVKQPEGSIDPGEAYRVKSSDTYKIEVYKSDGTFLWRNDLGWGVEKGIWYSPMLAYDLDGDGRAEVVTRTVKTEGAPRDEDGRVHSEKEFATVFDGLTGQVITEIPWVSRRLLRYGFANRNFLGVAYLDGKTPFLIVQRGTYSIIRISVYQLVNGRLEEKMSWSNIYGPFATFGGGAHRLHAADLDGDGREELCVGSFALDDNGALLWNLGLGHPDLLCVGDLNPEVPGLEVFLGVETHNKKNGMCMVKAATGEYIWGLQKESWHIGSGNCVDIDPNRPGCECSGREVKNNSSTARYWFSAAGELMSEGEDKKLNEAAPGRFGIYWDDTAQRILLRGNEKTGVMMKMIFKPGKTPNYKILRDSFSGRVLASGDFLGDWREEFITTLPGELRIYSTVRPAKDRNVCLLQDRNYRATTVENTVGYWSIPALSYDLQSKRKK